MVMRTVYGNKCFIVFHRDLFCDLFYFLEGIAESSYANDTTPYSANKTYDLVIKELEHFSEVSNCLALFQII